ncbi:chitin synthase chs-2-like isoform X1 [Eriocheir sinensis]|uniref:chitin synthase n=1 Tax=Eriocheir sinensis TaxID=95602 RepID=A0A0S2LL48_ERISI|nr:chitin synthase chs-2-like isoform X1 [Eriocheir sinensis]XP_050718354.1 chitin synthase chs-2-like isoform X1 [Eriocheir sinensis]XP_050718357.1 chitin synthase chs-2-like isoform X1 [Eriocheir sinensis]ALO62091.1 chitin synthase [Eriocheir sinensis]
MPPPQPPPAHLQMPLGETSDPEFSDDENAPLNQDIYGGSRRSMQETKAWDVFRTLPPSNTSLSEDSQKFLEFTIKCLKVFTYLLTFGVVLASGVITKGIVLLMTSQLRKSKTLNYCSKGNLLLSSEKDYRATLPDEENVIWAWMLFFCFIVPELGSWFRSTRMCVFKSWKKPLLGDVFWVFVFETLHTIGTGILIYLVLPDLDVIKGAMLTNCVAFMPGLFGLLSRTRKESHVALKVMMDLLALACQLTGFVVWPIVEYGKNPDSWRIWLIPPAIFLTSFGWWENYVDKNSKFSTIKYFGRIKDRLWKTRYFCYMFVSLWKVLVFFTVMVLSMGTRLDNFTAVFDLSTAFDTHAINVTEVRERLPGLLVPDSSTVAPLELTHIIKSQKGTPIYVFLIQVFTAWLCYIFGKFACKICIQGFSFAFPINLTIPVSLSLLITACGLRFDHACSFEVIPSYLFWECKNGDILNDFLNNDYAWVWLFWLLSQTWITLHIWTPKCERLASTEKLFVTPMYNSLLIDQSLALNRRRDDEGDVKTEDLNLNPDDPENEVSQYYETISIHTDSSNNNTTKIKSSDQITRIYATATMWHETEEEMIEMLKSILRMDEDQSARRVAQKYLKIVDLDYYEFETHIFFDDAFEISDENEDENVVNQFVKMLVNMMDDAATHVHQTNIRIRPPKKFPAPYGGRLVWTLPGKTKIVAHLKDKSKIRHKKRWSQVMYMYYLLGFKLMDQPISVDRKEVIAENTFLLTLDGDIDFTPNAVALLIDLMKKNTNLGAACGRIHPVGSGLMVWYQMFEYAIGHWLQKSTEHMIGCVLCSPGCFSLFRGKALMDDNVMRRYTTKSSQARHYVQYDQGEDRWLCTLLLQRGYRVEYSAASDAYTHAPEGFSEFYNQRRRWVPSTMANIMDLLQDYKKTIKVNDNISLPYISYQTMLMAGTILGPGTIFLMLVGAFVAAFRIGNWPSFEYNIIPILLFMIACFTLKSSIQITIAYILTAVYALVMIIVLVAMFLNFAVDGWNSPSAIFFLSSAASFVITGLLHPKEIICLPCGLIYYLLVPSMYLLLQLYSCFNVNNVSWGTREVSAKQKKKTREELEAERKAMEEAKKAKKREGFLGFLHREQQNDDEGSIEFSLAGLFKIMCCVHPKPSDERQQLASIANSLDILKKRFETIEAHMGIVPSSSRRHSTMHQPRVSLRGDNVSTINEGTMDDYSDSDSEKSGPKEERDDLVNPYWIEDKALKRGEVDYMPGAEVQFFKDLIEKYLHPLIKNPQEQRKMEEELKELRNIAVFSFTMMNAIFVLIVFLLQLNKDVIHIDWPLGVKTNITFVEATSEVLISQEHLQLEPIGLVFVFFFALILIIQFVAMLFHRFGTISHILASTELTCCNKKAEDTTEDAFIQRNAVDIVRQLQRLKGIDGDYDSDSVQGGQLGRRKTIHNLERHRQKKQAIGTLDVAFKKRFFSISAEAAENGLETETPVLGNMRRLSMRRETMKALAERRETVVKERRMSRMQTMGAKKPRNRTSIASDADHQRVFTPNGGSVNDAYESDMDNYGAPASVRSAMRYRTAEENVIYKP